MSLQAVILAAGKGTRMKSDLTKVMHPILGRPMIEWVVRAALDAGCSHVTVIVGHQRDQVREHLEGKFPGQVGFAVQEEQLGTGHAVWAAVDELRGGPHRTLILSGDVPNMQPSSLGAFVEAAGDATLGVMTAVLDDAAKYGRIIRSGDNVAAIVEWADATEQQREVREINTGFYVAETSFLCEELVRLCSGEPNNAQGEYYLTDLVAVAAGRDDAIAWELEDHAQMQGVNTRAQLASATQWARRRLNEHWMNEGVTMLDPDATYIDADVNLAEDVTLHPGVELRGTTSVGRGTTVGNSSVIENSSVAEDVDIRPFCHLEDARVESEAKLGPMCHLRPGADIGPTAKVGNFVEVKKSRLERGAKANHHAYIGDGFVGRNANIGAGTIFCNYDGEHKHRTEIGDGVFIGSNSALVAPVRIEDGSYVGAGSVITADVPEDSLAVARGRQRNIEGWARRKREE